MRSLWRFIQLAVYTITAWWFVMIAHEIGHGIAAILMGKQLLGFSFGSTVLGYFYIKLGDFFVTFSPIPTSSATFYALTPGEWYPFNDVIIGLAGPFINVVCTLLALIVLGHIGAFRAIWQWLMQPGAPLIDLASIDETHRERQVLYCWLVAPLWGLFTSSLPTIRANGMPGSDLSALYGFWIKIVFGPDQVVPILSFFTEISFLVYGGVIGTILATVVIIALRNAFYKYVMRPPVLVP